jgi:hypothetical protein
MIQFTYTPHNHVDLFRLPNGKKPKRSIQHAKDAGHRHYGARRSHESQLAVAPSNATTAYSGGTCSDLDGLGD